MERQLKLSFPKNALFALAFGGLLFSSNLTPFYADSKRTSPLTESINIKATRPDPTYERKRAQKAFSAAMSQMHSGGDDQCYVSEPLSLREKKRLRKTSTTFIRVTDGADEFLFDDSTIFRNLQVASLDSDRNNSIYIKSLALKYPNIQRLVISQPSPLAEDSIKCLKQFKTLTGLQLSCQIHSPEALLGSLPESLDYLQIYDDLLLPPLPHLTELRVNTCRLDSKFFEQLSTESLEILFLNDVDLAPGAFQHLGRFKSLREIWVSTSRIDDSDLQSVRALGYVSLRTYGSEKQRVVRWDRAEKLFTEKKFKEAVDNYKWSVFGAPSVYGYLQLARCYSELGDIRSASQNRDRAASMDPGNKEIAEFDSQLETRRRSLQPQAP